MLATIATFRPFHALSSWRSARHQRQRSGTELSILPPRYHGRSPSHIEGSQTFAWPAQRLFLVPQKRVCERNGTFQRKVDELSCAASELMDTSSFEAPMLKDVGTIPTVKLSQPKRGMRYCVYQRGYVLFHMLLALHLRKRLMELLQKLTTWPHVMPTILPTQSLVYVAFSAAAKRHSTRQQVGCTDETSFPLPKPPTANKHQEEDGTVTVSRAMPTLPQWIAFFSNPFQSSISMPPNRTPQSSPTPHYDFPVGIGIDLTPAYGTIAASFVNGSNIPLARIDGDEAWEAVMKKVATEFNFPYCRPCVDRTARMLKSLVVAGSQRLGKSISRAAASVPIVITTVQSPRPPPIDLLLRDAFRAADLEYERIVKYSITGDPVLFAEDSILAGHGFGLCPEYDFRCTIMPREVYYYVGYYTNALEVAISSNTWYTPGIYPIPYVDYQLGAKHRHLYANQSEYWEAVRCAVEDPMTIRGYNPPTKVIFYGECSEDPQLRIIVKNVLAEYPVERREWVDDGLDPVFVGAFGAAEFAKRKPFLE